MSNVKCFYRPFISAVMLGGALFSAIAPSMTASASSADYVAFRTPAGNIGCVAYASPEPGLRCDIAGGIKPLPPTPKDCQLDWGGGFELSKTGNATVVCAGDTAMNPQARTIPSGTTWRQFGFTCTSETSALRCNNADKHGFFLAKQHSYGF